MKKLLWVPLLLMLCGLAFGQSVPVCDPNHPAPNCTDYFGVGNWANSPLPKATGITGFTVLAAGSGYATPQVLITDTSGSGASAGAVTLDNTGAVIGVAVANPGSGYTMPSVSIVDMGPGWVSGAATCGTSSQPACGSGALVTAVLGAPYTGGIRKFKDALPSLAIAVPDTITFPGSDYYVISLQQYTAKMHTDLPPTTLRGYVQTNFGTSNGANSVTPPPISYLGPTIIAQKNRPVRVLFINNLPTGAGGNLFIPTDTTYMGAGAPYTQNRATLHLHGGATPWISDGTPHQWTVPIGETGPQRGASTQMVPDMWFDASGNVIAACAAQSTCATPGTTNDPGQGKMTFYWTNQQGGRLMFYHDHAYGITRLNVYAGEAAGYLLYDPTEENALSAATVPGTVTSGDLAHLIPLVIQDKTFVPSQPQLMAQDPTWVGNFGATPLSATGSNGDLWFPHVYMPNQNPADPGLANGFGRWDYGAWFFPAQTSLSAANPPSAVTVPCTSAAFPNQTVNCPITPNPSGTPEGFMDTPVLNGKAYPVLNVAPAAYRFKMLAAGNDRSWNLSWFVADATQNNTEVAMVPAAVPPANTLQSCAAINPVAVASLGIGLVSALLDASGNPLNGTGLPAGCWPNYGPLQGIPAPQTMWPADGRAGGVPDPRTAGPAWIQIGTEGGLLPAPVVIPATPINYEQNTRSITITSVGTHGLWLGPAERADVIVDFSKFAGKTLILYNDAPAPAPAIDSRLDYFTNDGDQTPIGGAPNTPPGYGPNTRTLLQVVVGQTGTGPANTTPFNVATLQAALPGLFAQTQPPIIVPEPTYPPASGGYSATAAYSGIHDYTLTYYPLGATTPVVNLNERKAIQELFTLDYGRMNATLGTELPLVNFNTQTTIPLGYIDPPSEIIKQGDTQLWKITHNGVDSHFIHFHLFNVQVINRVGWDGSLRQPDANELGWKDTVRMNPLEDILVALQPIKPVLPFPLRDSYRLMDVTMPVGSDCTNPPVSTNCSLFTNLNPYTNNPAQTPNAVNNFGWEYVWHCHILGHEENDMMRAITFQVAPEAPSNLAAAPAGTGLTLSWTDNSASETGFTLQRATDPAFTVGLTSVNVGPIAGSTDSNGQGVTFGGTQTYNDATATAPPYFYRVQAYKPDASYWTPTGTNITSAWSNTLSAGLPLSVSPTALTFTTQATGTTSVAQTVTLSNTSAAPVTFSSITTNVGDYAASTTCVSPVPANSTCSINVTFTPAFAGLRTGALTIVNGSPNPNLTVSLTGTGSGTPVLTITASTATMKYGAVVPAITPSYNPLNPAGLTTPPACTAAATSTSAVGTYQTSCSGAVDANYTIVYVRGTLAVTPVPLSIWGPVASLPVGSAIPTSFTPTYVGLVAGDTAAIFTPPTISPIVAPTCTTTATSLSPIGAYPITCNGAVDPNYTISYVAGTLNITQGTLTVTAPSLSMPYGGPLPTLTPTYSPVSPVGLTTPATCTTPATARSPVGTYAVTCSGAVDPNYGITYVGGTLTVNPAPLVITASSATMLYGGTVPVITASYSGFMNGDTPTSLTTAPTCSTTATSTSPVGNYPSSCSGAVSANYTITYVAGTLTVNTATVTITASSGSMSYGGTVPSITAASITGFVNGQTNSVLTAQPVCSTAATSTSPVGSYPSTCSGAAAPNYTFAYLPGAVAITPVPLTITANNTLRPYGAPNPVFAVTYAGLVAGNTAASLTTQPTCTTTAVANSPVSGATYPITCAGAVDANYSPISYVPGVLAITLAPASVTPNPASKVYGSADPNPLTTGTLTGFLASDGIVATYSRTAGQTVAGGPYTISATLSPAAALSNYTITYNTAAFSITPKAASVTPNAATKVYGAADPALTGTLTGFLPADGVTASYSRTAGVGVGTYTISATLAPVAALTNYNITYNTANFTITAKAASVTPRAATKVYGSADPVPLTTGTLTGFLAADGVTATYTRMAGEPVGTYTISATLIPTAVLSNYAITYNTAAFTISKASTTTAITSHLPNPANIPAAVAVAFTVTPQFTGAPGPTGNVTVRASGGTETCTATVAVGGCTITLTSAGNRNLSAVYAGDANFNTSTSPNVAQTVTAPTVNIPGSFNFGNVRAGTTSAAHAFTIRNSGNGALTPFTQALTGANAANFNIVSNTCVGTPLAPGASCVINVTFSPSTRGVNYAASITLTDNATNSPQAIGLNGRGN